MTLVRRRFRGMIALVALVTAVALVVTAAPVMAQSTSAVTQADCDAGRIKDKQGNTLKGERCERLIGQRVRLAQTGFEAWYLLLGGVACIGGAAALRMRRRPTPQLG
ncbi:MAG TPA: LPXTG cell wall anchor domain-containing protein [Thermoleophilaceae bacterium]|jgi:LPXTG-motif cell wall-anchored protein